MIISQTGCMISLVVIILMLQQSPQPIIKPLLVLTILSTIFCITLLVLTVVRGYAGFGQTYTASSVCNTYLLKKYETQINIGHQMRLIAQIIAVLSLAIECGFNIRSYLKFQDQQGVSSAPQMYQWSQYEVCTKYVMQSIAVLAILPTLGYFLAIMVEEGQCWKNINTDWLIFTIISCVALVLSVVCWIILVKFAVTSEMEGQESKELKIDHHEIRDRASDMKNIFEMEATIDMYKTNKHQNRQAVEPLLVENPPIPLFQSHLGKLGRKESRVQIHKDSDYQQEQEQHNAVRTLSSQQVPKKKTNHHQKQAVAAKKSKIAQQIMKKKQKFREINPFKTDQKPSKSKQDEQIYDDDMFVDPENKMKNLPRGYGQYIRDAKRPKRNTPNISEIMDIINKESEILAKLAQENEKPFLKKYRQTKEVKSVKENEDEIEFIEENEKPIMIPDIGNFLENKVKNEGELFYHKPKIDKNLKKKKVLFDDDVTEGNQYIPESQEKDVIINKLKEAKSHHKAKQNAKLEAQLEGIKSPKRKNLKTKEDILVNFLRSKFNVPNEDAQIL